MSKQYAPRVLQGCLDRAGSRIAVALKHAQKPVVYVGNSLRPPNRSKTSHSRTFSKAETEINSGKVTNLFLKQKLVRLGKYRYMSANAARYAMDLIDSLDSPSNRDVLVFSTSLLKLMMKHPKLQGLAHEYYTRMRRDLPVKDLRFYQSLLDGYAATGQFKRACYVLQDLVSDGLRPDAATVTSLIQSSTASCYQDTTFRATSLLDQYMSLVDPLLFSVVLQAYAKARDFHGANALMNKYQGKRTINMYTSLILALPDGDNRLFGVLKEMQQEGYVVDEVARCAISQRAITYTVQNGYICVGDCKLLYSQKSDTISNDSGKKAISTK